MEPQLKPVPIGTQQSGWSPGSQATVVLDQSKVLRNTYWLLALSMLPTIAGAYAGMAINFAVFFRTSPIMAPLLMIAAMIGSLFIVSALRNSGWGVVALFIGGLLAGAGAVAGALIGGVADLMQFFRRRDEAGKDAPAQDESESRL